jgi:low temperature requirement protein LtrA
MRQRHATWLELFADVIFVSALAAVVNRLGDDPVPRASAVVAVCGLFVVVQWAWLGQVFYDTRYDPDDLPHRLMVLLAIAGAGAITLGVADVPDAWLLPAGYLVVRGVLLLLYLRVRLISGSARPVTTVYLIGFGLGWLIWLGSLALPTQLRPAVWTGAMAIELLTPWLGLRWLARVPVDASHLPERIGQFIIIVLGSTLADLLDAVPARPDPHVIPAALVAFVVPASVWWVYTTFVTTGSALPRLRGGQAYTYVHMALGGSLLLLGWSLGQVLGQVAEGSPALPSALRLLLAASVTTWMLCGLGLHQLSVGNTSARRIGLTALGIGTVASVAATIDHPDAFLVLVAATLAGYAVLVTRWLTSVQPDAAKRRTDPSQSV